MSRSSVPLALLATLGACALPEELGETTQGVHSPYAQTADAPISTATMRVAGCLATKIAPTYAITSRACDVRAGDLAEISNGGSTLFNATVQEVFARPGTTVSGCAERDTCLDSSGLFGDLVVFRFTAPLPGSLDWDPMELSGVAIMHWRYPGSGHSGYEVGPEYLISTPPGRYITVVPDTLDSSNDTPGWFETTNDNSDRHDEGGGFWYQGRVLGTLWGGGYDVGDGNWQLYASVPRHLDWILGKVQYAWPGMPVLTNNTYTGTPLSTFGASELVCQYACDHTSSCEAYNFTISSKSCQLVTGVTGRAAQAGRNSALHYGASTGKSGDVVGYVRGDGYTSVVHKTESGAIHEFWRSDVTWSTGGLPTHPNEPPIAGGKLSAYRRADGFNVVLYRSTNNKLVEVYLSDTGWKTAVLTDHVQGDPVGFIRGDGLSSVAFRGEFDVLHEIHLEAGGWVEHALLPVNTTDTVLQSDPVPFVDRYGGTNIVFRSKSNKVVRIFNTLAKPNIWDVDRPSILAGAAFPAGRPYGYTRKNGTSAIVYRTNTFKLVELRQTTTSWIAEELTPPGMQMIHDPVAYVRTDAVESIVYRGYDGHLRETTRAPLQHWDLSAQYGLPGLLNDPSVYIRKDLANGVLLPMNFLHAAELAYKIGDAAWTYTDLTNATSEQL